MQQKLLKLVFLMMFLLCSLPSIAQQSPKNNNSRKGIALVIGNSTYQRAQSLQTASNDANYIAKTLTELGFEVLSGVNQNKRQMETLIDNFGRKLAETKSVGLFYYAGHAIQVNGENFLVPVEADILKERETSEKAIPLNTILSKMTTAKNKQNFVFLDASHKNPFVRKWYGDRISSPVREGLARISPPANTILFYSAEPNKVAPERCEKFGFFAEAILKHIKNPNLEFNNLAKMVSAEVSEKTEKRQIPLKDGSLAKGFYFANKKFKPKKPEKISLAELFEDFKIYGKCACGERDKAIPIGKEIVEKFSDDILNQEIIEYVKKQIPIIESENKICKRNTGYDKAYKSKNWGEFFTRSKEIIKEEGDTPLALDVMLTLVSVGYDRTTVDKYDNYNTETIFYAKKAIQLIESGVITKNSRWGVFVPFKTKENALSWLNYIIGYITYFRLNNKKEALPFLYKSAQLGVENKADPLIYQSIGDFYFDEAMRLDEEYRTKRAANNNTDNDETKAILGLARGYADRAIDAFGRAYKISKEKSPRSQYIITLYKTLQDLYRYRFNIAPGAEPDGLDDYFNKLISRPMPDPSTKIEPVIL